MRVALLCPGLGRANRGYERFASELFATLAGKVDIELYSARRPPGQRERTIGGLGRDGLAARFLGALSHDRYYWEAVSFALLAWRQVKRADLLHYSEPPLNLAFARLERRSGDKPRRLFSHALNMDARHTLRCHHIHQTSPDALDAAAALGVSSERMTLLPYGMNVGQFQGGGASGQSAARAAFGLPLAGPVLISVAAVNRAHKRTHVLVDAVARMARRPHLVLCGALDEPGMLDDARRELGESSVTHIYVEPGRMPELFAAADVFVHASIVEGFGFAPVEAQLSGLPALVHDAPHFRWLLGAGSPRFADMRSPEAIAAALNEIFAGFDTMRANVAAARSALAHRYDWNELAPAYIEMYQRAASSPPGLIEDALES